MFFFFVAISTPVKINLNKAENQNKDKWRGNDEIQYGAERKCLSGV
jgi:hypothetical protein